MAFALVANACLDVVLLKFATNEDCQVTLQGRKGQALFKEAKATDKHTF
jgi:hypothetical protein